ncbi:MAG: single-stranded DNA-binding protein [Bacteroidota bacterium]
MELFGRLTADAVVNTVKDGRKVVHFSIALNDSYKPAGSDEWKKFTTYVNCSYWISDAIAKNLTKGTLVEIYGRISVNAWINTSGEAKGSLNFHVNNIKLHGKPNAVKAELPSPAEITEPIDDLPF